MSVTCNPVPVAEPVARSAPPVFDRHVSIRFCAGEPECLLPERDCAARRVPLHLAGRFERRCAVLRAAARPIRLALEQMEACTVRVHAQHSSGTTGIGTKPMVPVP